MCQGIEITEMPDLAPIEEEESDTTEAAAPEQEAEAEIPVPPGIALDDPVRMYLKEIGRVPLLGMAQEQDLAKRIERAEEERERARLSSQQPDQKILDDGDIAKRDL